MKLVLFDIDGTLVYHIDQSKRIGFPRFEYAIKKVYGIDVRFPDGTNYSGLVDKQIVRSIVPESLFPKAEFDKHWPQMSGALFECAQRQALEDKNLYDTVTDTVKLASLLHGDPHYYLGLLTGNVEKIAYWKLENAGVPDIFSFGVFGDCFDDRISLARSVFETVQEKFHRKVGPKDITVIGDAVGDIQCGKAIGANTIIVMTAPILRKAGIHGGSQYKKNLKSEHPDLLVESLMDKSVLDYFGLKTV